MTSVSERAVDSIHGIDEASLYRLEILYDYGRSLHVHTFSSNTNILVSVHLDAVKNVSKPFH